MVKPLTLIGQKLYTEEINIEPDFLARLHKAINHPNPFSYKPSVLPPRTIDYVPFALLGSLVYLPPIYKTLGLNIKYVLLSRETSSSHIALRKNDKVCLTTYLKDAYEQQASSTPIGFCLLHTFGFKGDNLAFFNEKVLAIRGGFERRKIS